MRRAGTLATPLALILLVLFQALLAGCNSSTGETLLTENWVVKYDSKTADDYGYLATALYPSGALYVAGHSWSRDTSSDFVVLKYDLEGDRKWAVSYDGPANGEDWAVDLGVDSAENITVTGWSQGNATQADIATVRYGADGSRLWVARYDGPSSGFDLPSSLVVDYSGNVYVTGWSDGRDTAEDYVTIKYGTDGVQEWAARYDGPAHGSDKASAIAVDGWGNIYVTGFSEADDGSYDLVTIKYGSGGERYWVDQYEGQGGDEIAQAVAVDWQGNVYVTGWCEGNETGTDYITLKYDTGGALLWEDSYDGPISADDQASDVALDSRGGVYVTGWSAGDGTGTDYATLKYDENGNRIWISRYDGIDHNEDNARSLVVDSVGNVYVTGWSRSDSVRYDFATVEYDSLGNLAGVARYDGPARGEDKAYAVAVDRLGGIYVTGRSAAESGHFDYTIIKYSK